MIINIDDSLASYIDIVDKQTGKSVIDAGVMLTTWNTTTKVGNERRCANNSGNDNSKNVLFLDTLTTFPNAATIIKIPAEVYNNKFVKSILDKLLEKEKDVGIKIDR